MVNWGVGSWCVKLPCPLLPPKKNFLDETLPSVWDVTKLYIIY